MSIQLREDWLNRAAQMIAVIADLDTPHPYRIACGMAPGSRSVQTQVFGHEASADGHIEIFISPELADTEIVLDRLAWCMARAATDGSRPLSRFAKLRAAGADLDDDTLQAFAKQLGDYPHAELTKPKTGHTSQRKCECNRCEAVWRMSAKWQAQAAACPCCFSSDITLH